MFTSGCKRVFVSLPLGTEKDLQTDSHPQHPVVSTVLEAPRERQVCQNAKETQKALAEAIPDHSGPNSAEMRCFSENNFWVSGGENKNTLDAQRKERSSNPSVESGPRQSVERARTKLIPHTPSHSHIDWDNDLCGLS